MRRHYPAILHGGDGESWGLSFVDLPVHALGATMEAAVADAEALLAEAVADLSQAKKDVPAPTPVADIPAVERDGAVGVALIAVHMPGRARAISITLDEDLIDRIDAVASNRSAFLAEAARARLIAK